MPPKKTTDKVTKPKATPKKGRAGSTNNASPTKDDAKANQNLLFLWSCLQSTEAKVDMKAVAEDWGLSPDATRMRFLRLGAYIEKLKKAEQSEKDVRMSEAEDGNGVESRQEEDETETKDPTQILKEHLLADSATALEG